MQCVFGKIWGFLQNIKGVIFQRGVFILRVDFFFLRGRFCRISIKYELAYGLKMLKETSNRHKNLFGSFNTFFLPKAPFELKTKIIKGPIFLKS